MTNRLPPVMIAELRGCKNTDCAVVPAKDIPARVDPRNDVIRCTTCGTVWEVSHSGGEPTHWDKRGVMHVTPLVHVIAAKWWPDLDAVLRLIEERYRCVDGGAPGAYCAALADAGRPGIAYVTLTGGGIRQEGEQSPVAYATPADAIEAWRIAFWHYAEGRGGDLYWRVKPEVGPVEGGWQVRARLVIA